MSSYNNLSNTPLNVLKIQEASLMSEIQSKENGEITKKAARKNLAKVLKEIKKREKEAKNKK